MLPFGAKEKIILMKAFSEVAILNNAWNISYSVKIISENNIFFAAIVTP